MMLPATAIGKWVYDAGDSGDASVGLAAVPPTILLMLPDDSDSVTLATLHEPSIRVMAEPGDEFDEGLRYIGNIDEVGHLIEAAPELLAAVRAFLFQVIQGPVLERDAVVAQARAAYAKATIQKTGDPTNG
jgi:hypothetical protein